MTGLKNGTDYGTDDNQRFLWLVNATHPLVAGLAAVLIATLRGEPEKAAIFSYERGATMNGEFLAPARRIGFIDHMQATLNAGWFKVLYLHHPRCLVIKTKAQNIYSMQNLHLDIQSAGPDV